MTRTKSKPMILRWKKPGNPPLRRVCRDLHKAGVVTIKVTFDGYNDEGTLDEPEFLDKDDKPVPALPSYRRPDGKMIEIAGLVQEIVFDKLPGGWDDNDGSSGVLTIFVRSQTACLEQNLRFTSSEYHCHHFPL